MTVYSERTMFLFAELLRAAHISNSKRPEIKIAIIGSGEDWIRQSTDWAHEILGPKLKTFPAISLAAPNTRACPLTMNHPNCLVLVEGVDNSYAIQDFAKRNGP